MPEPVTLIVPTYTRLDGLKRLVESIQKNTKCPYKILVVVDSGYIETYHWAVANGLIAVMASQHRWYVKQTNLGVFFCDTELFCYLNDDMEIVEDGWLGRAVSLYKEKFPDGVGLLRLNDRCQPPGGWATCGMSSKKTVSAVYGTTFLCPKYTHYGSDKELTTIMRDAKLYFVSDIPIRHNRPKRDSVYAMSEAAFWKIDQAVFAQRKVDGFPR